MTEAVAQPKKPFDLNDLKEKLKERGLGHVEGAAREILETVYDWTREGVELTPTKLDDMLALPAMNILHNYVLAQVDKISPAPAPESPPSETI